MLIVLSWLIHNLLILLSVAFFTLFERKVMGYDPDEVMDYLTVVAAQMDALLQERNSLRDAIKEKELK